MKSSDGRWVLTFNGEIYNHLDIRRNLQRTWRGHSDTETLIEAISEWGVERTVKRLNGIFAFAALDRLEQRIYLARDPFGIKPVYYTNEGGGLKFASEIRGLRSLSGQQYAIDHQSLQTFLSLRFVPSPYTLLAGLMRLAPGHILTFDISTDEQSIGCYVTPTTSTFSGDLDEATAQYQSHVFAAVKRQLMSDVPVGVLLSGGIDWLSSPPWQLNRASKHLVLLSVMRIRQPRAKSTMPPTPRGF